MRRPFITPWWLLQAPQPSTAQPQRGTTESPAGVSARMASSVLGKRLNASQSDRQPEEVEAASEEQGEAATRSQWASWGWGPSTAAFLCHNMLSHGPKSQPAGQAQAARSLQHGLRNLSSYRDWALL